MGIGAEDQQFLDLLNNPICFIPILFICIPKVLSFHTSKFVSWTGLLVTQRRVQILNTVFAIMASAGEGLDDNLENYKAQLKQVDAALLIDEDNEDLKKLKQDLLEVIQLSEELMQINDAPAVEETPDVTLVSNGKEWKSGDRCRAIRKTDGEYYTCTVDMIADDKVSCTVKFDNSGSVDVVKLSSLEPIEEEVKLPQGTIIVSSTQNKSNKITREEIDKRREVKKKKLQKKKQRMKDFEEAREAGKNRWQTFFKKGSLKGKHKVKGINKKSIFASREDGKGKIGVGTCGTSGKGMTDYTPASSYMYKK
ncbi:survival of motor neuron-related-splicing factor 30-like [Hydractinia symbiolongicarpus]|uniref:survival of motor neuron-related-splicing factor 30-like n=1 Tax=Hydractinia symbiolongicarpus TaxID=13093 RepID=UPI00254DB43F|nr:survival of motor neuron-related-splicing factor 30-like [Hydractinia symbiolongicarpus]